MSTRSRTGALNTLTRKPGITLSFLQTPPPSLYPPEIDTSSIYAVKFTFSAPPRSTSTSDTLVEYDTGLHFHADKTEALRVEKGAIGVQLDDETFIVTPETGEVIVPRWTAHRWWLHNPVEGEDTVVWERTLPSTREKEVFFRTLISYLSDLPPDTPPAFFQMYSIFTRWDNFPVLATWLAKGPRGRLVVAWTYAMGRLGRILGYVGIYEEYVPADLRGLII